MATSKKSKNNRDANTDDIARTRQARPYPASSFTDALPLGEAIMRHASGEKVRRLTLVQQMDKSPNSGTTKMMITNSGKYGITKGSYAAEYLELTETGRAVVVHLDHLATDDKRLLTWQSTAFRLSSFSTIITKISDFPNGK